MYDKVMGKVGWRYSPFISTEGIPNEVQREGNYMLYSNEKPKQSQAKSSH